MTQSGFPYCSRPQRNHTLPGTPRCSNTACSGSGVCTSDTTLQRPHECRPHAAGRRREGKQGLRPMRIVGQQYHRIANARDAQMAPDARECPARIATAVLPPHGDRSASFPPRTAHHARASSRGAQHRVRLPCSSRCWSPALQGSDPGAPAGLASTCLPIMWGAYGSFATQVAVAARNGRYLL